MMKGKFAQPSKIFRIYEDGCRFLCKHFFNSSITCVVIYMFLKQLWFSYTIFKVAFYYFLYNAKFFSITIFSWWFSWFFRIANVYQCYFILNILCDDSILLNHKVGILWFIHWLPSMPFHHGLFVNLINKQILYCFELVLQIL